MNGEFEWKPGQDFQSGPIEEVLGRRIKEVSEHRVFGPRYAWEVSAGQDEVTRVELFPERSFATVNYVDGSLQSQQRNLILDYLIVRTNDSRPLLTLASVQGDRGKLINVYPSGEIDEHFRIVPPSTSSEQLPARALIFSAEAPTPAVAPPPKEQTSFTVDEAATRLGFGTENVRRLLRQGRLAGYKRAGAWYIPKDAIAKYQNS